MDDKNFRLLKKLKRFRADDSLVLPCDVVFSGVHGFCLP